MILGNSKESLMTRRSPLTQRTTEASDAKCRATAFSGVEPKRVCHSECVRAAQTALHHWPSPSTE